MRVSIISQYNVNMFPALYFVAASLADRGFEVQFISRHEPTMTGVSDSRIVWQGVPKVGRLASRIPGFRANYHGLIRLLTRFKPDRIIAQQEYLSPALLYRLMRSADSVKVVGYFSDYYRGGMGMTLIGRLSRGLDAYVDVCHVRAQWRQRDWPGMRATPFIIRQAPRRQEGASYEPHEGTSRVVYTGSRHVLDMDRDRLSRFVTRLCQRGVSVDWYIAGSSEVESSEELRSQARGLTNHPLYRVREPLEKSRLLNTLRKYDAGLFWAPMAELNGPLPPGRVSMANPDVRKSVFLSSASNKIGEYIAAGLVVAHTGNPGLSYLPAEVFIAFDPTDPETGADQLAVALSDRSTVEQKRKAALLYHDEEMNFEAQAAPFIYHLLGESTAPPSRAVGWMPTMKAR